MAAYQIAECSSGLLQNGCISASYSTACSHAPLASAVYRSPELVVRILLMQISSHVFLNKFRLHAWVVELVECCARFSKRLWHQYTNNSSSSSTIASEDTFTPHPLGSNLVTTVWLKKFNDDGCEDDEDQDLPDDGENPTPAMPRSLSTLRFACHFHKRAPSRYCAAGCRYKACENPGWENIAGVT
jgi:hypothetical protein